MFTRPRLACGGIEGHEPDPAAPQSLSELLSELTNRPVGDRRLDRLRAHAVAYAERTTSSGPLEADRRDRLAALLRRDAADRRKRPSGSACLPHLHLAPAVRARRHARARALRRLSHRRSSRLLDDAGLTGFIASSVADCRGGNERLGARGGPRRRACSSSSTSPRHSFGSLRAVTALAWQLPVRPTPSPRRARRSSSSHGWSPSSSSASSISGAPRDLDLPLDAPGDARSYVVIHCVLARALVAAAAAHGRPLHGACAGRARRRNGADRSSASSTRSSSSRGSREQEETYGVLGVAAGLLFGFFLFGRTVELAAALNACSPSSDGE